MARRPRFWYPGALFHITARGNRGSDLFYDQFDFESYLELVQSCQYEYPFKLHAFCLMSNHVHLLIEVQNHPPGDIMKYIQFRYAKYFNRRHDITGHVFQGRYYSSMIDSIHYLLEVSKYIHLNPVKAGVTSKPGDYKWSSYHSYMNTDDQSFLSTNQILEHFNDPKNHSYECYVLE